MKRYIKPTINSVELRTEERLAANCGDWVLNGSVPNRNKDHASGCWIQVVAGNS